MHFSRGFEIYMKKNKSKIGGMRGGSAFCPFLRRFFIDFQDGNFSEMNFKRRKSAELHF